MERIEGRTDIVRDPHTGAIINIDSDSHKSAVQSSKARENFKKQMLDNTNDINSIKEELSEIKDMMKQLVGSMVSDGR